MDNIIEKEYTQIATKLYQKQYLDIVGMYEEEDFKPIVINSTKEADMKIKKTIDPLLANKPEYEK